MVKIKKLSELHQATPHGVWEAQTYSVAKQDGTENGVSIYISETIHSGRLNSDRAGKIRNCYKLESALRGLLAVIKHYETGYSIDRNCFDEIENANSALYIDDGKK